MQLYLKPCLSWMGLYWVPWRPKGLIANPEKETGIKTKEDKNRLNGKMEAEERQAAELLTDSICEAKENPLLVGRWYGRNYMEKHFLIPLRKHMFFKKQKQKQYSIMENGMGSGACLDLYLSSISN